MSLTGADICVFLTCLSVISTLVAHAFCSVGPRVDAIPKDEIELFGNVPLMFFPFLVPALLLALFEQFVRTRTDQRAVAMSRLIVLDFLIAMAYYYFLYSNGGGIAFKNMRSEGAARPEYLARYVGWAFACPTTTIIINLPLLDRCNSVDTIKRLAPTCLATSAYVWACYVGMVVEGPVMGWWLCVCGCLTYLATLVDQVDLILEQSHSRLLAVKVFPVVIKEVIYVLYTVVYLISFSDYISSYTKESAFCFFDMTAKTVSAIFAFLFWAALPLLGDGGKQQQHLPNLLQGAPKRAQEMADAAKGAKAM